MRKIYLLLSMVLMAATMMAQDSTKVVIPKAEKPLWKQKLYYGYNFDIYYHHDSRPSKKENGWSISITPELGWRLNDRMNVGLRFGGSY